MPRHQPHTRMLTGCVVMGLLFLVLMLFNGLFPTLEVTERHETIRCVEHSVRSVEQSAKRIGSSCIEYGS